MRTLRESITAGGLLLAAASPGWSQDSALTAILVANRHPLRVEQGRVTERGGELLVAVAAQSTFFLVGEEHGVAETPELVSALLRELRPLGYSVFAIEVSPLQGRRLDAIARRPNAGAALDTLLDSWDTMVPFYGLAEERSLLRSAMQPMDRSPPMEIWGLDYEVIADRLYLRALAALAPASGRAAVGRAVALADSGFAALVTQRNPGRLFAWSAPDSVFTALREAFGARPPARASAIIDLLELTARINRLMLSGRVYESNLLRSRFLRQNFAPSWERVQGRRPVPKVLFKFGGSHMMRGLNYTHSLDLGTAATVVAESRGEEAFSLLVVGGTGSRSARMNPMLGRYEATGVAEVDASRPDSCTRMMRSRC